MKTVLALAVLLAVPSLAVSQELLDQQQTEYNGGTSARTLPGYTVWQSFTAGITGRLTSIEMGFFNPMSGDADLRIYAGEGTAGQLLQTLHVPITAVDSQINWNRWSVDSPSIAGQVYTFEITPNGATLPDPYGVCIASPGPYAEGEFGVNDPSGSYPTEFDAVFRTYVTPVPEPASFLTLGASLLLAIRRKK